MRYASEVEADAAARRLISPRFQDDPTRAEANIAKLAEALEYLPTSTLTLLEQQGYRYTIVPESARIVDLDDAIAAELLIAAKGDLFDFLKLSDSIAGVTTNTHEVYLQRHDAGAIIHETGHAIDISLGMRGPDGNVTLMSQRDSIFDDSWGAGFGPEILNSYSKLSRAESVAEWLRGTVGAPSPSFDGTATPTQVRNDTDERAPNAALYWMLILESIDYALEFDPEAFSEKSRTIVNIDVVARAGFALVTETSVRSFEELPLRDLLVERWNEYGFTNVPPVQRAPDIAEFAPERSDAPELPEPPSRGEPHFLITTGASSLDLEFD